MRSKSLVALLHVLDPMPTYDSTNLANINILGISADSKKCEKGFLFIALRGATSNSRDGHDFIGEAIANGATAVVVNRDFVTNAAWPVPIIYSQDSKIALSFLAEAFFDFPSASLNVIGITGTNGKTSTCFMLHSILKCAGFKPKILGTLGMGDPNNLQPLSHTTMDPVFLSSHLAKMQAEGVTHVVMEVSSHALSLKRVEAIKFKAVALTNITQDHLDFHGSLKEYQQAKSRLFFELVDKNTSIVLPSNHPFKLDCHHLTNIAYYDEIKEDYIIASLKSDGEAAIFGDFHFKNAQLAATLAQALKVKKQYIEEGLTNCPTIPGRLEAIKNHLALKIFVDFAHTPDALKILLSTLKKQNPDRLILVFGCGGDRDRLKRPLMGQIAAQMADLVIITDDNPRSEDPLLIRQAILGGIKNNKRVLEIADRSSAIHYAIKNAQKNDIVVIAGKGHEKYQIYGHHLRYFSDQDEARKVLDSL